MNRTWVPDEVWRQLDPGVGKLSRRTTIAVWVAIAVAVALLVAGTALWRSGIVVPRLVWATAGWGFDQDADGTTRVQVDLTNGGRFDATVESLGRSAPGLELLAVTGIDFPVTLRPGETRTATLVYRIEGCDQPPRGDWPVTARVDTLWGSTTVDVARPRAAQSWQELVVDTWCDPPTD